MWVQLVQALLQLFHQASSWEMRRYTLRPVAWACRDVYGHLRGEGSTLQAGSILPGLTQPLIPPALCLHCNHPHLFQPWRQTRFLPPQRSRHQFSKPRVELRLRRTSVYGHRGFRLETGRFHYPNHLSIPSEFSSNYIPSSKKPLSPPLCLDILDHPTPSKCSEVMTTANMSETSFSPKLRYGAPLRDLQHPHFSSPLPLLSPEPRIVPQFADRISRSSFIMHSSRPFFFYLGLNFEIKSQGWILLYFLPCHHCERK